MEKQIEFVACLLKERNSIQTVSKSLRNATLRSRINLPTVRSKFWTNYHQQDQFLIYLFNAYFSRLLTSLFLCFSLLSGFSSFNCSSSNISLTLATSRVWILNSFTISVCVQLLNISLYICSTSTSLIGRPIFFYWNPIIFAKGFEFTQFSMVVK